MDRRGGGHCRCCRLSSTRPTLRIPPHRRYHCPPPYPLVVGHHSGCLPLSAFDAPDDGWLLCCLLLLRHPPSTFVGPRHHAIVDTFVAGRRLLTPTFASRCSIALVPAIHHICRSRRWLVVAFSARPAAYQLNHQAENVFIFPHLDLF